MADNSANVDARSAGATVVPIKAGYTKPELQHLGDLRSVTLGGSPGSGDSGAPSSQSIPGPPI